MIIMIIIGTDEVNIFCTDIFPLAFPDFKISLVIAYFGVLGRPSGLFWGILLICGPPGVYKNDILIRLMMKKIFHYGVVII